MAYPKFKNGPKNDLGPLGDKHSISALNLRHLWFFTMQMHLAIEGYKESYLTNPDSRVLIVPRSIQFFLRAHQFGK
jgi:hypothetical protein